MEDYYFCSMDARLYSVLFLSDDMMDVCYIWWHSGIHPLNEMCLPTLHCQREWHSTKSVIQVIIGKDIFRVTAENYGGLWE